MNQHMKLKHQEFYRQQIKMGNLQSGPGRVSARSNLNRMRMFGTANRNAEMEKRHGGETFDQSLQDREEDCDYDDSGNAKQSSSLPDE